MKHYKTAESVTKGHPDKLCDYIADSILDSYLQKDPESRVAVEVMATKGLILVAGEVTSTAKVHIRKVVKYTLRSAGYTPSEFRIKVRLHKQSPDIARGVTVRKTCSVQAIRESSTVMRRMKRRLSSLAWCWQEGSHQDLKKYEKTVSFQG